MKILVIGGSGFWGSKIVNSFSGVAGLEVSATSRSNRGGRTVRLDWDNIDGAFVTFMQFDVIINASELPSTEIIQKVAKWVTENAKIFIETSAVSEYTKYLLNLRKGDRSDGGTRNGLFVFGAGVFPGLSNLIVRYLIESFPGEKNVDMAIRYSIFSEAGKGMCELMAETLLKPSFWISERKFLYGEPVGPLKLFKWNDGNHKGMRVGLSDVLYWAECDNIESLSTYLSLTPGWINSVSKLVNKIPKFSWMKSVMGYLFFLLRGKLFRTRRTQMQIMASNGIHQARIESDNSFYLAGLSLVIMLEKVRTVDKQLVHNGIFRFDELVSLTDLITYFKVYPEKAGCFKLTHD